MDIIGAIFLACGLIALAIGVLMLFIQIIRAIINRGTNFTRWGICILVGLSLTLLGFVIAIETGESDQPQVVQTSTQQTEQQQQIVQEIFNNVAVSHELQNTFYKGKQKLVIWVKNNSNYTFSGLLSVTVKDNILGNELAHEIFDIKNLKPGLQTYGILWIEPSAVQVEYQLSISSYE